MANPDQHPWSVDQVLDVREYDRCRGITQKGIRCQNPLSKESRQSIATLLPEVNRARNNADRFRLHEVLSEVATHALCYRYHRPREDAPPDQRRNQQRDNLLERLITPFDHGPNNVAQAGDDLDGDHAAAVEDEAGSQTTRSSNTDSHLNDHTHSATPELDAGAENIRHEDGEDFRENDEGSFHDGEPINERSPEREQFEETEETEGAETGSRRNDSPDWEDSWSHGSRLSTRSNGSPPLSHSTGSAGGRRSTQPDNSIPRRPSLSPPHISPQARYPRGRRPQSQPQQPREQGARRGYPATDEEGDAFYGSDGFNETNSDDGDYDYDEEEYPYGAAIDRNRYLENNLREERSLVQLLLEEHTDLQSAQVGFARVRDAYYRRAQDFNDHQPSYSRRYGGDILRSRDLDPMSCHREDPHPNRRGPRSTRPTPESAQDYHQTPPHSRRAHPRTSPPPHTQHGRQSSPSSSYNSPPVRPRKSRADTNEDQPWWEYRRSRYTRPSATDPTPGRTSHRRRDGRTEREI